jgi:hypothetical protein
MQSADLVRKVPVEVIDEGNARHMIIEHNYGIRTFRDAGVTTSNRQRPA